MLISGLILFSCTKENPKENDENKVTETLSIAFLTDKNKVTVEGKEDVNDFFKSLFIRKTPQREISAYTEEQIALNSTITIEGDSVYVVNMPYNTLLNLDEPGILTTTITCTSAPGTSPTTLDIPISIEANEFAHEKMSAGIVKKLPKKIGTKDIEKEYSIHFKYAANAQASASSNCDLFPTSTKQGKAITNLSFTRDYPYRSKRLGKIFIANNSYVCENAITGHGPCENLSKTSKVVTPLLTKTVSGENDGSSEEKAIEMHFEGGTLTGGYADTSYDSSKTTISKPENSFDIADVALDYSDGNTGEKPKFTMPDCVFIADGAALPDGAFFSIEGLIGTNCDVLYGLSICPKNPYNRGFVVYNPVPHIDNGIIFKVVAQNGKNQKFYKLIFKNKFSSSNYDDCAGCADNDREWYW
ncbi:hypothetical protein JBKA6_0031 [Ichthyobacterium seriolicida]|uniref:Uncharacterized protein n=2 Tax=Ichthyobacterium seriolicida TaxID=242600 RepID=A0A1J1E1Y3_9FLAO|nr:hypothetical protein JBKA6_0031 [Ichthyobacterium seriolicida]